MLFCLVFCLNIEKDYSACYSVCYSDIYTAYSSVRIRLQFYILFCCCSATRLFDISIRVFIVKINLFKAQKDRDQYHGEPFSNRFEFSEGLRKS